MKASFMLLPPSCTPTPTPSERERKQYRDFLLVCGMLTCLWLSSIPWLYHVVEMSTNPPLRLEDSYAQWADKLYFSDVAGYIRAGLGFASGHGIAVPVREHGRVDYRPYSYQGAGTPFLIGLVVLVFGAGHVLPYFLLICMLHLGTALCVVYLARTHVQASSALLVVGLLALFPLPVLGLEFGPGLLASEPPSFALCVLAFIPLQHFWRHGWQSRKAAMLDALAFGTLIGLATYVRGVFSLLGVLVCGCALLCLGKKRPGNVLIFAALAFVTLQLVQLPWELRNERVCGEACMCRSLYYGRAEWQTIWKDWRQEGRWLPYGGQGLGNYLRPDLSAQILHEIAVSPCRGTFDAAWTLARAIGRQPRRAIAFRLAGYDTLWLGVPGGSSVARIFCMDSLICLLALVYISWREMTPELWAYPLLMLCMSPLLHYEQRYVFLVYICSTPIACAIILDRGLRGMAIPRNPRSGKGDD